MPAAIEEQPAQLVGPDGQPVESEQKKLETQQDIIRRLFAGHAERQMCQVASVILGQTTTSIVRPSIHPVRTGATRMSFSLAFRLRGRFLEASKQPPASIEDPHRPISERRRREVRRFFRERPDHVAHLAADRIIGDAEFSGSIVDTWRHSFEEAQA
jgi:hypothetical protein